VFMRRCAAPLDGWASPFEWTSIRYAPDAVMNFPHPQASPRVDVGPEAITTSAALHRVAFPNLYVIVDEVMERDDPFRPWPGRESAPPFSRWRGTLMHSQASTGFADPVDHLEVIALLEVNGGVDEARTRDLRRDRPEVALRKTQQNPKKAGKQAEHPRHDAPGSDSERPPAQPPTDAPTDTRPATGEEE